MQHYDYPVIPRHPSQYYGLNPTYRVTHMGKTYIVPGTGEKLKLRLILTAMIGFLSLTWLLVIFLTILTIVIGKSIDTAILLILIVIPPTLLAIWIIRWCLRRLDPQKQINRAIDDYYAQQLADIEQVLPRIPVPDAASVRPRKPRQKHKDIPDPIGGSF